MPDRVTVTSTKSWFSRLSESISSVLIGVVFFVGGFPLLFWNEGRAVRTARSLTEGAGVVQSVSADSVDPSKSGQLVHVSSFAKTDDVLEDATFGVSANAVKLARRVEMYQWTESESSETETNLGGSEETKTTYTYDTDWSSSLVDSSSFHSPAGHENPRAFPYESTSQQASTVRLGAYTLSSSQVSMLDKSEPLRIETLPSGLSDARLHDGYVYIGTDPSSPQVGDTRVRFSVVQPGPVSVVARQVGESFEPYQADAGGSVFLLQEAVVSAEAMFETAQRQNTMLTWILRGVGFFVMFLGLSMVFRPIAVFGDVVPIVGRLLGAGIGLFSGLVAAFFALGTIAIAWIVYRPLLGVVLLALAVGAFLLLVKVASSRASSGSSTSLPPLPTN